MEFNPKDFNPYSLEQDLLNGIPLFIQKGNNPFKAFLFAKEIDSSDKNQIKIPYIPKKNPKMPDNYDLLNQTGGNFAKYKKFDKYFLMPYADAIFEKYGAFIKSGHLPVIEKKEYEKNIRIEEKPCYPTEKIQYFHRRSKIYKGIEETQSFIQPDSRIILINADYPGKAATFVFRAFDRYASRILQAENGNMVIQRGFSRLEFDSNLKCVKSEYEGLSIAVLLLATHDVVSKVDKKNLEYVLITSFDPNMPLATISAKKGRERFARQKSLSLISIARSIKAFVNLNSAEAIAYEHSNDVFFNDFFVKRNIDRTRKVIDKKCDAPAFELINSLADSILKAESEAELAQKCKVASKTIGLIKTMEKIWQDNKIREAKGNLLD